MTPASYIALATVLAAAALAFLAGFRIENRIPTEDSTPRDLNRKRASNAAAALNLSRAVRRMH